MRRLVPVLALALATPAAAEPEADPNAPVVRSAKARLVGDAVQIEARIELDQDGPVSPTGLTSSVALPSGAVITGATVTVGQHRQRLQLLDKALADKRLEILSKPPTASGGRMWAVRIDSETPDVARIEIAAARAGRVQLDLTLEVPACFADDARNILVPPEWTNAIRGDGKLVTTAEALSLSERCHSDGPAWFAFTDRALARKPAGEQRVGTRAQLLSLGTSDVARVEISIAKQLSEIPLDLHTVLVVDHSRSMTSEDLETQRAAIAAYLRAAPSSRVQLVGYARDGRTLLPGWTLASQASNRIDRELRALIPRNGSNVDRGLAVAATLLEDVRGTRRIVLFTDDRLAERFTYDVASLAPTLPPNILVHVVSVHGFGEHVTRNSGHVLEPLALATTGAAFAVNLDDNSMLDALPLVRPVSLDNISITSPEWASSLLSDSDCSDTLAEGTSCASLGEGAPLSKPLVIEGWLWGTKVVREIKPDRSSARSLARRLVTWTSLPGKLLEGVQAAAECVNDAWSLLATWGPRGGYGDLESYGRIGIGSIGTSSSHSSIGVGRVGDRLRPEELISQLGPVVRACKPLGKVSLVVELTQEEIVDLSIVLADDRDRALSDCITNAVWDASLVLTKPPHHATLTIDVPPR